MGKRQKGRLFSLSTFAKLVRYMLMSHKLFARANNLHIHNFRWGEIFRQSYSDSRWENLLLFTINSKCHANNRICIFK